MFREENALLTQTVSGTPCGESMRRYWQPGALSEELAPGTPSLPVKPLDKELVRFREGGD